jgi:hypothetical protein
MVPIGTHVCIVALLATFVARHVLMLLQKTLLVLFLFNFICHMIFLVVHVSTVFNHSSSVTIA